MKKSAFRTIWRVSVLFYFITIVFVMLGDFYFKIPLSITFYYILLIVAAMPLMLTYRWRAQNRQVFLEQKIAGRTAELAEALRIAELANRSKSAFLANMSHELRTPLNAILGFSGAMQHEVFGPITNPTYKEYIDYIQKSGMHLLNLVNDVLDLSKIEAHKSSLHFKWVNVYDVLQEVLQIISGYPKAAERHISVDYANKLPRVWADARMIKQMLLNLLSNAIKFTQEDGHIRIRVYQTADREFCICVQDDGVGIPSDKLSEVRQPFNQVEEALSKTTRGSGLGLSLVDKLIALHNGKMEIESRRGKGTSIYLLFSRKRQGRKNEKA